MSKTSGSAAGTVLYWYDQSGHLLGEYSSTGALVEETVWLGDIPVATLRPSGSTVAVYYVHSDQLNTPREVTRPSDNKQMWTWFFDPFATTAANTNPAGAGVFTFNLRFPGQIFDGQAGLHQNMARDYDPAVGKYIESDLMGLKAGVNTYAYVDGNPIRLIDPSGLAPPHPGRTAPSPLPPGPLVWPMNPQPWSGQTTLDFQQLLQNVASAVHQACTKEPDCVRATGFHFAGAGIFDPEEFKRDFVGNAGSKFDICACTDGSMVLAAVGQCGRPGPKIGTGATWKK